VGNTDIALAWFGGKCVATLREADTMEGRVVRVLEPARRRESLNASLEARIAVMVTDRMLQ
jgi:hypothetical protein